MEYLIGAITAATGYVFWVKYQLHLAIGRMTYELEKMQRQIDEDTARLRDEFGIDLDEGAEDEFAEWDC